MSGDDDHERAVWILFTRHAVTIESLGKALSTHRYVTFRGVGVELVTLGGQAAPRTERGR